MTPFDKSNEADVMQVGAETYIDDGVEKLRRIRFDDREIEESQNLDQWQGKTYRYFKVKSSDGDVYILRHNEIGNDWELTMYERAPPMAVLFPNSRL